MALARIPEDQIAIIAAKPKPERQGYQMSSMAEWRTWSGASVDIIGEVN